MLLGANHHDLIAQCLSKLMQSYILWKSSR